MTLIISAVCPDYLVQVSDRRLTETLPKGRYKTFTDEENKTLIWKLPAARLAVSYAGVARIGQTRSRQKSTESVLCELMLEAAKLADYDPIDSVEQLRRQLTERLRKMPADKRRLSLVLDGFLGVEGDGQSIAGALLTNYQVWGSHDEPEAWEEFTARYESPLDGIEFPTIVHHLGAWNVVRLDELEEIRSLLLLRRPPVAVVGKIRDLFTVWVSRMAYPVTIGPQASSLVIRRDRLDEPTWQYHTEKNARSAPFGAIVHSYPGTDIAIWDSKYEVVDPGQSVAVPHVPRRRPCPCGSGKQYRLCHGKRSAHG